jgi:hypothetical protein
MHISYTHSDMGNLLRRWQSKIVFSGDAVSFPVMFGRQMRQASGPYLLRVCNSGPSEQASLILLGRMRLIKHAFTSSEQD